LVIMLGISVAVIYGVSVAVKQVSEAVNNTKETLKNKGLNISDKGVSVKTTARFNREDYVDATQRGFLKAMGAASFGTSEGYEGEQPPISMSRQNSSTGSIKSLSSSSAGGEEGAAKKKRGLMGRKSSH